MTDRAMVLPALAVLVVSILALYVFVLTEIPAI